MTGLIQDLSFRQQHKPIPSKLNEQQFLSPLDAHRNPATLFGRWLMRLPGQS